MYGTDNNSPWRRSGRSIYDTQRVSSLFARPWALWFLVYSRKAVWSYRQADAKCARAFILQQNLVRNDVRRHQCGAKMQTQRLYPRRAIDCAVPANIYKNMTWFTASAQSFAQWCLLSIYTRVMCMFDMPLCSAYTSITLRMQHQSHLIWSVDANFMPEIILA